VPAGERWIQEIKFEGCRVPLHLANETVLQNELKGNSTRIVMAAFDLLYLSGYDPRKLPPIERKTHLKEPIANTAVQFSESFEIDGPEMFTHACGIGLEGVVSKVRDSRDVSDHGNDWVKKTCSERETLPIAAPQVRTSSIWISNLENRPIIDEPAIARLHQRGAATLGRPIG
jgi:ATP-dependent DNA ligase